jgi:Ca2+-binding RTX toxin-like protein
MKTAQTDRQSKNRNTIRPRLKSFRPRLEVLEDRRCPAVTWSVLEGHILAVMGDRGNNTIGVVVRGDQVDVTGDDAPVQSFTGIDSIRVNAWAGRDTVRVVIAAPPPDPDFSFAANLGDGDDFFNLSVSPPDPDSPPPEPDFVPMIRVAVTGGSGGDTFQTFVGQLDVSPSAPKPILPAGLALVYDGGDGTDQFFTAVANVGLIRPVTMTMNGGPGNDTLISNLLPAVQSGGSFSARFSGGIGDDNLFATVVPAVQRGGMFSAVFDGGDGNDTIVGDVPPGPCEPESRTDVSFLGGRGNDVIGVQADVSQITPDSGQVRVAVDGGDDSDRMVFRVIGVDRPMENVLLTLDGGAGEDFALVSALVRVTNCEHVGTV